MINGFPKLKQYGDHSKDLGIKSANKSKIELIHLPYNRFRGNDTLWNETKPASGEILLPPAGSHSHPYSSNSFPFGATHLLCMTHTLYILGLTSHGNDNTCCKTKSCIRWKDMNLGGSVRRTETPVSIFRNFPATHWQWDERQLLLWTETTSYLFTIFQIVFATTG